MKTIPMPKTSLFIAILALSLPAVFVAKAEDAVENIPPVVESKNPKIKAADVALEKADAEALKAFALAKVKARQKVIADLKEAKMAALKAEKLDEAVEIKRRIELLEKETDGVLCQETELPIKPALVGKTLMLMPEKLSLVLLPNAETEGTLNAKWCWDGTRIHWRQYGSVIVLDGQGPHHETSRTLIYDKKSGVFRICLPQLKKIDEPLGSNEEHFVLVK